MLYIYWFRKDLRIEDSSGLNKFIEHTANKDDKCSFIYIKNENSFNYFGEKRISFLIECLKDLIENLGKYGFRLQVIYGKSFEVFQKLIRDYKTISVYSNSQVEPYCIARDNRIRKLVVDNGGNFNSYQDTTVFDLNEIKNIDGKPYKVYSPFKNQAFNILKKNHYTSFEINLSQINNSQEEVLKGFRFYDLDEEYKKLSKSEVIKGGRKEGAQRLNDFLNRDLESYKPDRDFPSVRGTSMISAHLHFGTLSIRELLRKAFGKVKLSKNVNKKSAIQIWINELLWREFYYHITFHNPRITKESFKTEYDNIKWNYAEADFKKWCDGKTGFPIVDAGMRQMNNEGWMHNRLRMITAMFLTKDLLIDWRYGEKYFADKLIDLDFSNNNGGWQWSASTGVDAQPYFRVFNPYLQSKKFDAEGHYIKKYVPELKSLPVKFIHEPHLMNQTEQQKYEVEIGKDYPEPMIDHLTAKNDAIRRFKELAQYKIN